jgi:hypothetical protein
MDSSQH